MGDCQAGATESHGTDLSIHSYIHSIFMLVLLLVLLVLSSLSDSVVLYNSVLLAKTSNPSTAPTVLLLHGLLGSSRNFGGFARTLHEKLGGEHNIVSLDARNHGRSVVLGPMPISYDLMSSDVIGEQRMRRTEIQLIHAFSFIFEIPIHLIVLYLSSCT